MQVRAWDVWKGLRRNIELGTISALGGWSRERAVFDMWFLHDIGKTEKA